MSAPLTIGRRVATREEIELPGDYCGPFPYRWQGEDCEAIYFLKPNARDEGVPPISRCVHWVKIPPHRYRECPDGSLEIRESLGENRSMVDDTPDGWHGYLDEGHRWRQV